MRAQLREPLTAPRGSPCSDSDEEESTKEDNTALLRFHLKYEADVLFTRWAGGCPGPQAGGCPREVRPNMQLPMGGSNRTRGLKGRAPVSSDYDTELVCP